MTDSMTPSGLTKDECYRLSEKIRRHILGITGVAGIRGNVWERVKDSFSRHRRRSIDGIVMVETDDGFLVAISLTAYYDIVLPMLAAQIQYDVKSICYAHHVRSPVSVRIFIDNVVLKEKE